MPSIDDRFAQSLHHATREVETGQAFSPPIVNTTIYHLPGTPSGTYQYARWANPTWTALEESLEILEEAPTVIFPSGMAAIASIFYTHCRPGDRILLPSDGYYTIRVVAEKYLAPFGVEVLTCPTADLATRSFDGLRLVLFETPSNPALVLADIAALSKRAQGAGALAIVDNTTMTPLGQRPLDLGADAVVSSDSKAVNGHSDVLFGHVASRRPEFIAAIRDWRRVAGAVPGPFEAWLVHRGLESLEVRWARICANAQTIAERLQAHPRVVELRYPGLPSHPQHALAQAQMASFGGLVAVTLADEAAADRFIGACRYVRAATSFGGLHTSAERRARWGDQVAAGFIRLSVGCEPTEALWKDLARGLEAVG
jgi:cystathionine gamma-lyase